MRSRIAFGGNAIIMKCRFGAVSALILCAFNAGALKAQNLPDLSIFEFTDPGAPRASGSVSVRLVNSSTQTITTDVVIYRGSVNAGAASEILRKSVKFDPWAIVLVQTEAMALAEGDLFSACVDPGRKVSESNENNNCEVRGVSTKLTDLSIGTADISMNPVGAAPGQPVKVNARIHNSTAVPARTLVRLFQGHPKAPNNKLLGQVTLNVPASGFAVASWSVNRPDGDPNFFVSADDVVPRDTDKRNNLETRNVFLKAVIDTGRRDAYRQAAASYPAIGDLLGTGQPVMVFGERTGSGIGTTGQLTAMQIFSDGTTKELWSKVLMPSPSDVLSPSMADLDGDGQPEIIVEVSRNMSGNNGVKDGEIHIFALDKNGNTKWKTKWITVGRAPCHSMTNASTPAIGDMNKDGIADVVVLEKDLVILDGRNGAEILRKPGVFYNGQCSSGAFSAIADLDDDGKNELIVGDYGIHVYRADGSLMWERGGNNLYDFALLDTDKDGKAEVVVPVHRQYFLILDGRTGGVKKQTLPSNQWSPFASTIAATTSLDANEFPSIAIANNDYSNGIGLLDNNLGVKWFFLTPVSSVVSAVDNPQSLTMADVLGIGRPQIFSRSDRRHLGIQDSKDGKWLEYFSIFGWGTIHSWPIPVDVDGDGRGEVIVQHGTAGSDSTKLAWEPTVKPTQFYIYGSDAWKKIPITWNQRYFVPGQVDNKLAFRHDYQPWKSHNTWMQQPLRKPCDIDYDDDIDQNDVNLIFAARGQAAQANDWRDIDRDGTITVTDGRACSLKCTLPNCAAINQPARILSVTPRQVFPGTSASVTIRGEFGNFRQGQTTVSFGTGVTVGAVTVLDTDTAVAQVTVASGQTGERTATVKTGTVTATRQSALALSAGNNPPVVNAGAAQTVVLPGSISLSGIANDDGQPNGKVSVSWQMVGGPGSVTFSSPNSVSTTASFSQEGFYVLRLSASDGQYFASDDVGITIIKGNQAPYVSAGPDLRSRMDVPVVLNGDVQDDGLPLGNKPTILWSKVSGPGALTLSPAGAAVTTATFSVAGTYELKLSASDGLLSGTDTVIVTVDPPLPRLVTVGPDSGVPGQSRTVSITGQFTHFVAGQTKASFGAGVSVGGAAPGAPGPVTVVNATTATAEVTVASGATLGARTVTVATGAEQAVKANGFTVGTIGVPYAIRSNLSDVVAAPGASITARPEVLDAAGNLITNPAATFSMTVSSKQGLATGNTPVVNGLTVSFPKLKKRLLNQDPEADPNGEFADADPTDPNYGRETGGLYTLTVSLGGTQLKGTTDVAVIPSGTAEITLHVNRLAGVLGTALDGAKQALSTGSAAAIAAARAQIANVDATTEFSPKVLATNNVLTPPNGFPFTLAQVTAKFPQTVDDASYGRTLDATLVHLRLIRTRIAALSAATISQADLEALRAAVETYKTLNQQLHALKPGPAGVTQNEAALNELLTAELPLLLNTITKKSLELLAATAPSTKAAAFAATGLPDQLLTVFSNLFSIFTDLAGTAKGNIMELAISLANDLVNMALANAINEHSDGGLAVDFVAAGGQFSFVCPNWLNTYVEATGLSSDLQKNSVAVIGCLNSYALRSLLTLKPSKDLAGSIRLFFKIKGLVEAMGRDQSIAANASPDELREGLFGGAQMVFKPGWPRVNQGRLPCVGIVIVFNLESGSFHAVNANMLPSCE